MRRLFIMRKDLQMSPGKLAAQVGHCAEAYWTHILRDMDNLQPEERLLFLQKKLGENGIWREYVCGTFTKTICEARNKPHLLKAVTLAEEQGLKQGEDFGLIYDNCFTELQPEEENGTTLTGIWFRPLPDETAHAISRKYHLYV